MTAAGLEYAKPVSNRLNATGRAIDMEMPLKDGDRVLGDLPVRINADDSLLLSKPALLKMLSSILDGAARERLSALPSTGLFVSLRDLKSANLDIRFDQALQELTLNADTDQRATAEISLAGRQKTAVSSTLSSPAQISGYINIFASLDHQWQMTGVSESDSETGGRLELDSAVRTGNVVYENRGVVAGSVDVNDCPTLAFCDYTHTPGFKRQTSRLVYDMPEDRVRMEVGDVEPLGTSFQTTPDMLGVSFEKSARKLSPGDTFAPTGNGTFRVDRPSAVEIRINGAVRQRLQLRPGTYNLRDLPLATGANDIEIVITDDTGNQHTVRFSSFFDQSLLAAGKSEWGLSVGAPSYIRDEAREYVPDLYMGSWFLRYGLTDQTTAEFDLQSDSHFTMAGTGAVTETPWGLVGVRAAGSAGETGAGFALGLDWSLRQFPGFNRRARRERTIVF
jgi:outer membrane usher protein